MHSKLDNVYSESQLREFAMSAIINGIAKKICDGTLIKSITYLVDRCNKIARLSQK